MSTLTFVTFVTIISVLTFTIFARSVHHARHGRMIAKSLAKLLTVVEQLNNARRTLDDMIALYAAINNLLKHGEFIPQRDEEDHLREYYLNYSSLQSILDSIAPHVDALKNYARGVSPTAIRPIIEHVAQSLEYAYCDIKEKFDGLKIGDLDGSRYVGIP